MILGLNHQQHLGEQVIIVMIMIIAIMIMIIIVITLCKYFLSVSHLSIVSFRSDKPQFHFPLKLLTQGSPEKTLLIYDTTQNRTILFILNVGIYILSNIVMSGLENLPSHRKRLHRLDQEGFQVDPCNIFFLQHLF